MEKLCEKCSHGICKVCTQCHNMGCDYFGEPIKECYDQLLPIPKPGSKEAQEKGCLCPVVDNHYGKGIDMGGTEPSFWYSENCPIHGYKYKEL